MTTIVFHNGVMGADSLLTHMNDINSTKSEDIHSFDFYDKLRFMDIDGTTHLFGFSGNVNSIDDFFDNILTYKKLKSNDKFTILDWDEENLYFYRTHKSFRVYINTFFNYLTFNLLKLDKYIYYVKREKLKYNTNDIYSIGSGSEYVESSFEKLKFQVDRTNENIHDHLSVEEIIKYLIKIASLNDIGTNDKIYFASFNSPDSKQYTCIPSECESVERVIGNM